MFYEICDIFDQHIVLICKFVIQIINYYMLEVKCLDTMSRNRINNNNNITIFFLLILCICTDYLINLNK